MRPRPLPAVPADDDDVPFRRTMTFVGSWRKTTESDCAARYPDGIEFAETRFLAHKGPTQGFVIWDVGGYRITAPGVVRIGIATDEQVEYRFTLEGDTLVFRDAAGCEIRYTRG